MREYWDAFMASVRFSFSTVRRGALTTGLSALVFIFLVLSSFPSYSLQAIGDDPLNITEVFMTLLWDLSVSIGVTGVAGLVIYAVLTGISLVVLSVLVREQGFRRLLDAGSLTPAFLIGGCAACGAGVLGFLGFVGALGLLPFGGTGLRLLGIALLVYFLASTGNPRTCRID